MDKRKVYICLTTSGLKMRNKASNKLFALEKVIKSKIAKKDLKAFFGVLDTLSEILESEKKDS